ncbi:MAG: alkaline phosphatase PhoX [Parvularculaceae bacterium]
MKLSKLDRRDFLRKSGFAFSAGVMASPFSGLVMRQARAAVDGGVSCLTPGPFGPVAPVADDATGLPLIQLPSGFSYQSFGWTGDRLNDGLLTPDDHDGMGVVAQRGRFLAIVRNHEISGGAPNSIPDAPGELFNANRGFSVYDAVGGNNGEASGGTSTLIFDTARGEFVAAQASIGGTRNNCAGGIVPFGSVNGDVTAVGSWITCEETDDGTDNIDVLGQDHGFALEVPGFGLANGNPIFGMGRFAHEALAVDVRTNAFYLSEDAFPTFSGFYCFVPNGGAMGAPGRLDLMEGQLYMLAVAGQANANLTNPSLGDEFDAEFVPVPAGFEVGQACGPFIDVSPTAPGADPLGPFLNDVAQFPAFAPFVGPTADGGHGGVGLVDGPATIASGAFADGVSVPFNRSSAFVGGFNNGGAFFRRPEGVWYDGATGAIFFADTEGGLTTDLDDDIGFRAEGVIWSFTPAVENGVLNPLRGRLVAVFVAPEFESNAVSPANNPDNITVNPVTGTIFFCEDGGGLAEGEGLRLSGVAADGNAFTFAINNVVLSAAQIAGTQDALGNARNPLAVIGDNPEADFRGAEWAGATFSPDGNTLFVNFQIPGITFAITGPFT